MYRPLPNSVTVMPSSIQGLGLVCIKEIPQDTNLGLFHLRVGEELIRTPLAGFTNHSDEPNCVKTRPSSDRWELITLRNIKVGEELTTKYDLYNIGKENVHKKI